MIRRNWTRWILAAALSLLSAGVTIAAFADIQNSNPDQTLQRLEQRLAFWEQQQGNDNPRRQARRDHRIQRLERAIARRKAVLDRREQVRLQRGKP